MAGADAATTPISIRPGPEFCAVIDGCRAEFGDASLSIDSSTGPDSCGLRDDSGSGCGSGDTPGFGGSDSRTENTEKIPPSECGYLKGSSSICVSIASTSGDDRRGAQEDSNCVVDRLLGFALGARPASGSSLSAPWSGSPVVVNQLRRIPYPSQGILARRHLRQLGVSSSHLSRRDRHVQQPVNVLVRFRFPGCLAAKGAISQVPSSSLGSTMLLLVVVGKETTARWARHHFLPKSQKKKGKRRRLRFTSLTA